MPTLSLDPTFNIDRPILLDPSLDPAFPFSSQSLIMNGIETPTPMMSWPQIPSSGLMYNPAYPSPSCTPAPDEDNSSGQVSPSKVTHRRGRNADKLAIEEAQKLIGKQISHC